MQLLLNYLNELDELRFCNELYKLGYWRVIMTINVNRIFLIGYMGSGKTTIANVLSRVLGFNFVDMDSEIEKAEEATIRTIFIKYGEHEFRNKEAELLDKLCHITSASDVITGETNSNTKILDKESKYERFADMDNRGVVVSCGGGIILDDLNRTILKNQCTIFLNGNPKTLFERVDGDTNRPFAFMDVADEKKRFTKFFELYKKRKPLYEETSIHTVNIDGKTPEEIASEILQLV